MVRAFVRLVAKGHGFDLFYFYVCILGNLFTRKGKGKGKREFV